MAGSKDASARDWDKVSSWLAERHPGFESNLVLRCDPGQERGLITSGPMKSGDTLLHIPASSMLNPLTLLPNSSIPSHLFPQVQPSTRHKQNGAGSANGESAKRAKLAPTRKLDTTQLLTLHLVLTKDPQGRYPSEWAAYIETLPRDFRPWHPLTWLIEFEPTPVSSPTSASGSAAATPTTSDSGSRHSSGKASDRRPSGSAPDDSGTTKHKQHKRGGHSHTSWAWWNSLAEAGLSPSTQKKLGEVRKRFDEDYAVLVDVLREEEPFKSDGLADVLGKEEILWAWLNVPKTRYLGRFPARSLSTLPLSGLSSPTLLTRDGVTPTYQPKTLIRNAAIVNTRSISIPLGLPGPSERMNHTLVPIMDFINHSSDESVITPRVKQLPTASRRANLLKATAASGSTSTSTSADDRSSDPSTQASSTPTSTTGLPAPTPSHLLRQAEKHLIPGKIDFRLLAPSRGLDSGEEVFFEYGAHGSGTLFTEYGFCEAPHVDASESKNGGRAIDGTHGGVKSKKTEHSRGSRRPTSDNDEDGPTQPTHDSGKTSWLGMRYGQVDLSAYVDELWDAQDLDEAVEKRGVLEGIGCWNGNTLHSNPPASASPSHSLLMTLRVLHLPTHSGKMPSVERGLISYVSPANEGAMLRALEDICRRVVADAKRRKKALSKVERDVGRDLEASASASGNGTEGEKKRHDPRDEGGDGAATNDEEDDSSLATIGVLHMLKNMCEEEIVLATEVLEKIEREEEFS